jgi:formylmethanofuran dehydrogenase subunit C
MLAGELFARGDVGDDAGVAMRGGTLVVGGDAGHRLGEPLGSGTIFLRGRAASLADGMVEAPLRKSDDLRLGVLLINASIRGAAKEFRRVIPERLWRQEQSRITGEVRPNWR